MKAVLLLAHGSPDSASESDIREFLNNVTGGRALPDAAIEEIRSRYEQIGRSPLGDITARQAGALGPGVGVGGVGGLGKLGPFILGTRKKKGGGGGFAP